jgi:hypothetical protein
MPSMAFKPLVVSSRARERASKPSLVRAVARERRRDGVLHRAGAAEPAVGELLDGRQQVVVEPRRAAHRHPAGAPARREVGLRQRRERDDRRVRIEARQRGTGPS